MAKDRQRDQCRPSPKRRGAIDRANENVSELPSHDATYWDLEAVFETGKNEPLAATLATVDGRKIPAGKDFDSATGKLKNSKLLQLNEQEANDLATKLRSADFKVTKVEVKPFTERPRPPFTTSTLQQEANRKLGFTAQRTMSSAQRLYENGYITYMRTDSTTLSKEAIGATRTLVRSEYGENFLHPDVRVYKSKVKERPGGSRSDSAGRDPVSCTRDRAWRTRFRSIPSLRSDLETNDCLSDGRRQKATG